MKYINEFSDPCLQLERKQDLEFGCGGCACHQPTADRRSFECSAKQAGYPDETSKTCRMWRKRRRRN